MQTERSQQMKNREIFNYVNIYHITARCAAPLHIGSADGDKGEILVHPVSGKPFIQASGLAGCFREYTEKQFGVEARKKWYGDSNQEISEKHGIRNEDGTVRDDFRSRIVFTDGKFGVDRDQTLHMEYRTRVSLDKETGTTAAKTLGGSSSGQVLQTEYISAGSVVSFDIYEYYKKQNEKLIIPSCLKALDSGRILIGGQVSNGCGEVKLEQVTCLHCDMKTSEGRKNWREQDVYTGKDILSEVRAVSPGQDVMYDFYMDVDFDRDVLVKGEAVNVALLEELTGERFDQEHRPPDVMQLLNGKNEFVIPGSSIKGVFRNRMEMILDYLNRADSGQMKEDIFENRSNVYFYDAFLEKRGQDDSANVNIHVRNHVDKFTGGVMDRGLFAEAVNNGASTIHVRLMGADNNSDSKSAQASCWTEKRVKQTAALILLTMRDCAIGAVTLGSGYSVGRGFMTVHEIRVESAGQKLLRIDPKDNGGQISSPVIADWLGALQKEGKV